MIGVEVYIINFGFKIAVFMHVLPDSIEHMLFLVYIDQVFFFDPIKSLLILHIFILTFFCEKN